MSKDAIQKHFNEAAEVLNKFNNEANISAIDKALQVMVDALKNGHKILSCGNGGSMCDAMHFAEELSGRFRNDRKALAAISISDPSHISCVANDYGFEFIFSRYVEAIGNKGDVLLGISTSGNSKNVILAFEAAKKKGLKTVALTGKTGGILAGIADLEIRAPQTEYADRAQEIHIKVIHALIDGIEKELKLT
ncbi:MAG: D-sedoheptulose 7-phosphate isomerase [Crocinitomicaceae bacterium]|mgnify:CR=1 FL=1|jgi:D-sedoheptulose 7-phosphate isomerase|tara:strand:+ start:5683 stop:6261 length:579 start_codon:yes stop_codon:yes gene_type:complete